MTFHDPSVWFLLLLPAIPVAWWWASRRRPRSTVGFSTARIARSAGSTLVVRLRWLVPALRCAALVLLVVALARPRQADEQTRISTEGIAIELVLDRSGSMEADDFVLDGRRTSRLEAVKKVVEDFVAGTDRLGGRPDDIIGLITFSTFADSLCPLTLDHVHLVDVIRATTLATQAEGASTAIGDALALAVERLGHLDERDDLGGRRITSRIIILLTDGANNAGEIEPTTAAQMAAAFGIKVYTIGAGSRGGVLRQVAVDPFTGREIMRPIQVSIDEESLREIADVTGGAYYRATDTESLERIYATIGELERTKIEQHRYTRYSELAVDGARLGALRVPPLLVVVFTLLAVELLLASTKFRTLT